ncbi:hypothetical protein K488DRAFT_86464 [Vararia minispora EC-137]|uniref:Uncharacterized protein n=1 Tax=Vararia minispora EC-137 TaxID=1314806 RepID=A0ACB8QIW4_9AGAM|nr:hypothetical protein K488DRAFT_86464 [Vararia minispora EC-137]
MPPSTNPPSTSSGVSSIREIVLSVLFVMFILSAVCCLIFWRHGVFHRRQTQSVSASSERVSQLRRSPIARLGHSWFRPGARRKHPADRTPCPREDGKSAHVRAPSPIVSLPHLAQLPNSAKDGDITRPEEAHVREPQIV